MRKTLVNVEILEILVKILAANIRKANGLFVYSIANLLKSRAGVATYGARQLSPQEQQQLQEGQIPVVNSSQASSPQDCADQCAFDRSCNSAVFVQQPNSTDNLCVFIAGQGKCGDGASTHPNITIENQHVYLECIRCPGQEIAAVIEATPSVLERTSAVPTTVGGPNTCSPGEF